MEEKFVSERDYEVFRQAVKSSEGFSISTADDRDDLDLDTGTLIYSGDSRTEKVTWMTQPSLMATMRHCARVPQGVKCSDGVVDSPLWSTSLTAKFKIFSLQNVLGREHYRLKRDQGAEYLPTLLSQGLATGARTKVSQCRFSFSDPAAHRRTDPSGNHLQLYNGFSCGFIDWIHSREDRNKVIEEQVKIMSKASKKSVASAMAAASNLQLVRRDVALWKLLLQDEHIARARTAPFGCASLVGPDPTEFDSKVFAMRKQYSLHRALTSHPRIQHSSPSLRRRHRFTRD